MATQTQRNLPQVVHGTQPTAATAPDSWNGAPSRNP